MIHGHGGNTHELSKNLGCSIDEIIDMSSNLNPLGPPPGFYGYLKDRLRSIVSLPEVDASGISKKVAGQYGVSPENIIAGNGTTQLIYTIPKALKTEKCLIAGPTYADYRDACRMYDVDHAFYYLKEENNFLLDADKFLNTVKPYDTVFICNPNNPTGGLIPQKTLETVCSNSPDTLFIIDESYLPFVQDHHEISMVNARLKNVIVLNSMSKVFRIPGLRVGFLIAPEDIIERFSKYMMPWSVNSMAQSAVSFLTDDRNEIDLFLEKTAAFVKEERELFVRSFEGNGNIQFFPGKTYFVLGKLLGGRSAYDIYDALSKEKFLIRNCDNFNGLSDQFIRVSLKDRETNMALSQKLQNIL